MPEYMQPDAIHAKTRSRLLQGGHRFCSISFTAMLLFNDDVEQKRLFPAQMLRHVKPDISHISVHLMHKVVYVRSLRLQALRQKLAIGLTG
ncbi:hypothetical protein D1872_290930 [compost metagenome]